MQVQQDVMNNFLSLLNTRFVIPVYQRNYAWEKENCAKLLEDIVSISKGGDKTHFMGTITYIVHHVPLENGIGQRQEYVIIDGQQRITSTMLLLKALQDKIKDEGVKRAISRVINDDSEINRLRLKPIKKDFEAFQCVMEGRASDYSGNSAMKANYQFFRDELDCYMSKGYRLEDIYGAFLRLKIVAIGLVNGEDDPQVVFESINATGVQLKGVDLIRNYLLMGENSDEQERLYGKYWKPIEDEYITKARDVENFLECYLRIYQDADITKDVYFWFKKLSKEHFKDNFEDLMRDMLAYAKIYRVFLDDSNFKFINVSYKEDEILRRRIGTIVKLKFGVSYSFIMRIIRDFEDGKLDFENFDSMLKILISYYVRRQICKLASNALGKVMYGLYDRIKREGALKSSDLAYHLGNKSGRELFPDDVMLKKHFVECDAYSLKFACKFILFEIEKLSNVDLHKDEGLSIEHFYPQNSTNAWKEMVGEDYQRLESTYLHTFGNLTLSGQNLQLGNKSFDDKLALLLEKGSLRLNEYLTNMTSWGIQEIESRSAYLAERFCEVEIFKDLSKEYRNRPILTLDQNLTYHSLSEIKFPNGDRQFIKNAKDLGRAVISYLYKHKRDQFEEYTSNFSPSCIVWDSAKAKSRDKEGSVVLEFKEGGFYFVSNASFKDMGNNLKKLIQGCGLNPSEFVVG